MDDDTALFDSVDTLADRYGSLPTRVGSTTARGRPPPSYEVQFIHALQWGLLGVVALRVLLFA